MKHIFNKKHCYFWLFLPLLILTDISGTFFAHTSAYLIYIKNLASPPPFYAYFTLALITAVVCPLIFILFNFYKKETIYSIFDEIIMIAAGITFILCIEIIITFFYRSFTPFHDFTFSRMITLLSWILMIVFISSGHIVIRILQRIFRQFGWGIKNVLIIGTGEMANILKERIKFYKEFKFIGVLSPQEQNNDKTQNIIGNTKNIKEIIKQYDVDEILIAEPAISLQELKTIINTCASIKKVNFKILPDIFEFITTKIKIMELGGLPLISFTEIPLKQWHNRLIKRIFDIFFGLVCLIICLIPMVIIAIIIKIIDKVPVLYAQERLTKDKKTFLIYKFRTMQVDSEVETGPVFASKDDERCTEFGGFLRRTSLDELPQLFNILKGDMSVVGPRPERPFFINKFQAEINKYPDRHLVNAGFTGWAQVNGLRGDTSIKERLKYDLYYLENWSFLLDIKIISKSIVCVISDFFSQKAY